MFNTEYLAPGSLEELLSLLSQHGGDAKIIAGGTDLIPQMRLGKIAPRILIDPRHLPLEGIVKTSTDIRLGALFTHKQAIETSLLKEELPALVNACQLVGGPPVRNRGTLAGNLANASPAADSALPLLAYDAQVVATRSGGERIIPLGNFFIKPGQTCLAEDEFIREIRIPRQPARTKSVFLKLGIRKAMAIAVASVAVCLTLDKTHQVMHARIALGSVAPIPLRATNAEATLQSNPFNEKTIHQAAEAAQQAASPISDLRASAIYRSKMVAVLTRRALEMTLRDFTLENIDG